MPNSKLIVTAIVSAGIGWIIGRAHEEDIKKDAESLSLRLKNDNDSLQGGLKAGMFALKTAPPEHKEWSRKITSAILDGMGLNNKGIEK